MGGVGWEPPTRARAEGVRQADLSVCKASPQSPAHVAEPATRAATPDFKADTNNPIHARRLLHWPAPKPRTTPAQHNAPQAEPPGPHQAEPTAAATTHPP